MFIQKYNTFNKMNEENADSMVIIIKNNITKIFETDIVGLLSDISVRNNYTNISIKTSFYDEVAKYILYIKVDNIEPDNEIQYIFKKYNSDTTELIGMLDDTVKTIDNINEEFFVDIKTKIDEKFTTSEDELGLEYENNV